MALTVSILAFMLLQFATYYISYKIGMPLSWEGFIVIHEWYDNIDKEGGFTDFGAITFALNISISNLLYKVYNAISEKKEPDTNKTIRHLLLIIALFFATIINIIITKAWNEDYTILLNLIKLSSYALLWFSHSLFSSWLTKKDIPTFF